MGLGAQQKPEVKRVTAKNVTSMEGKELYGQYCAVCHGMNGKGGGPASSALKKAPTDLTLLAHGNKGTFPATRVQQVIDGGDNIPAHGATDMPVWGKVLRSTPTDQTSSKLRVYNLTHYIESMQLK